MAEDNFKDLGFEEETEQIPSDISKLQSLGKGLQSGATFGFSDELAGGVQSLLDRVLGVSEINKRLREQGFTGDIGPTSPQEVYVQAREEERAESEKAKKAGGKLFTAGELLGSAILPGGAAARGVSTVGKIARGAAVGAGTGAVGAAGLSAEMPTTEEVRKGAVTGAVIGGGLPVAGTALKRVGRAAAKTELGKDLMDILFKSAKGVDFSDVANLRSNVTKKTKDIITKIDESNLAKIQQRDKLLKEVKNVDLADETSDLLNKIGVIKEEAVATTEPVIRSVEKRAAKLLEKGAGLDGKDYLTFEKALNENIDKAIGNKDTRLAELLQNYKNLVQSKVYSADPRLSQIRKDIFQENEMLKLLTGEAAPEFVTRSPAEMEKLIEQAASKLEAPAGTSSYAQTQKFFEGVKASPGVRSTKIPGFQQQSVSNLTEALKLQENLRNLELSKKLTGEGIQSGSATPTGLISVITGGAGSALRQSANIAGRGIKATRDTKQNITKKIINTIENVDSLNNIVNKLQSKGKTGTAKTLSSIAQVPDLRKRQALTFAALQRPDIRQDLSDELEFTEETGEGDNE